MSSFLCPDIEARGPYKASIINNAAGERRLLVIDLSTQTEYEFDYLTFHGCTADGPLNNIKWAKSSKLPDGGYNRVHSSTGMSWGSCPLDQAFLIIRSNKTYIPGVVCQSRLIKFADADKLNCDFDIRTVRPGHRKCTCGNLGHGLCSDWCDTKQ